MTKKTDREGRRDFLQTSFLAGAAAVLAGAVPCQARRGGGKEPDRTQVHAAGQGVEDEKRTVFTTCLGCNARCGLEVHVCNERIDHVSGNPYHPYNMAGEPLDYATPLAEALAVPAPACAKAQEAMNYAYSPYRITQPLKRAGRRGEGKFEPISWERLVQEVADGGRLFASAGDNDVYPGLKDVLKDDPIDPKDPGLGSMRNGFVFIGGRDQGGYKDFSDRFVKQAVGSTNRIGHTDICGLGFRMGNYALTEGKDVELKADPMACEYMLVFGANVYEALQPGINFYGALMARRHAEGSLKFVVVDPRGTNASAHADAWLAVKPGQDNALAMGLIRVLLEENLFDSAFLSCFNEALAAQKGFTGYTNACHLVVTQKGHAKEGRFLLMEDVDPALKGKDEGKAWTVAGPGGKAQDFDKASSADLDFNGAVALADGSTLACATSFALMKKEVLANALETYSQLSGIGVGDIQKTARDFAAHGRKAGVCQYHGAGNYVGGTYAAYAVAMLSVLVGSINQQGGYMCSSGKAADWKKGLFDLASFSGARKPEGVKISREGAVYEKSAEYREKKAAGGTGYPARRPWYSFTRGGLCTEAMNGIDQGYPYGCKVLFTFFFNPVYSIPGGQRYVETLKDKAKVPLHVSIDVTVNESNIYADYIVPNLTYLEGQYSFMSPHAPALKFTTVRFPAIEPLTGQTADGRHFSMETFLVDLAEYLKLPGFGKDAIKDAGGGLHALHKAEDYYVRGLANLASNAKLPKAGDEECAFVRQNYPLFKFRGLMDQGVWRQVCTMAVRGGIFKDRYEDLFKNGAQKKAIARIALYNEKLASSIDSITGKRQWGTLRLAKATEAGGGVIAEKDAQWPFAAVTYKMNVHGQSRTSSHKWSMELFPENFAYINVKDCEKLGVKEGETVRIASRHCPEGILIKARPTALVAEGVVAVSFHYGHTQCGASKLFIKDARKVLLGGPVAGDAAALKPDARLGKGASFNKLGRLDESQGRLPLTDPLGGIPDFSSTRVNVAKA